MAKQLEAFVKEYAALMRELDSAALQLKESEQRRAEHDDALRGEARALGQRVGALRAGGTAVSGTAASGSGLDAFKADPEVRRILGSLDERLARAQADGQHDHGLAAGAWRQALERAAGLEKELAAEIAARQKQLTTKTGLGNKSVPDMVRLQADMRKKLAPRRAALQAGEQALLLHKDPEYFRKKRDEWIAAALNAMPAAGPAPKTSLAATPPAVGQPPKAPLAATPNTAKASTAKTPPAPPPPAAELTPKTSPAAGGGAAGQPPKTPPAATPNTAKASTAKPTVQTATAKTAAKPAAASTSAKTGTSKGDAAPPAAATPATPAPAAATPAPAAASPAPAAATPSPTAATPTSAAATVAPALAASGDSILTAAAFKVAGKQARVLFAAIRTNATAARKAARSKNRKALSGARTNAARRLRSLEPIVQRYELARQRTGDAAIVQLRNGRQILTGIKALVAVRAKARAMVRALARLR